MVSFLGAEKCCGGGGIYLPLAVAGPAGAFLGKKWVKSRKGKIGGRQNKDSEGKTEQNRVK